MIPNLVTGSASSTTHPARDNDQGFAPDVARSILQQWAEVKGEDGVVERVFTQVAQTWALADNVKFENIEAAIQMLWQACDYLYQGLKHVGSMVEQKVDAEKMQKVVSALGEIVEQIKRMQEQMVESSKRTDAMSARIDQMLERISDAHRQLEQVKSRREHGEHQHQQLVQSTQMFTERCGKDIDRAWMSMAETQADLQARDQHMDNPEEVVFHNAVTMERGLQQCHDGLASLQIPDKGQRRRPQRNRKQETRKTEVQPQEKPPMGFEHMTSRLLSGCSAN